VKLENGNEVIPCALCGCTGNNNCGHDCLDTEKACTLDFYNVCSCCLIDKKHMEHAQGKRDAQILMETKK